MSADDDWRAESLRRLWLDHAGDVHRFARRTLPSHDAEDIVAETFAVAWRRIDDVPADARPWLFATARNVLMTRARSAGRRYALLARLEAEPPGTPTSIEEQTIDHALLTQAWQSLAEADREALALTAWEGLTSSEAAIVVGCTRSAFAIRLMRARRRLQGALDRLEDSSLDRHRPMMGGHHVQS